MGAVELTAPQAESDIQTSLLRKQAEMLLQQKHDRPAMAVMRKMIDRESDDVESLIDFVEWLVKNKAWSVVDEVAKRFDRTFSANPRLLYTLAQARKAEGNPALAEQFAERAFAINANSDDMTPRFVIAAWLEINGMMDWCEREFRFIIGHDKDQESEVVIRSRFALSELLHDEERDGAAAEILQGLVDLLAKNGALNQKLTTMRPPHPPKTIRSRLHYFYACQFAAKNDRAKQIEQLDLAKTADPTDADVLIALYHLPDQDQKRRKETGDLIRDAAEEFRNELNDDPDQASVYNEYAWLIANTEGNLDRVA